MNKIIIILLSGACLFTTSCKRDIEYGYATILTFENKSSHTVDIKVDSKIIHWQKPWSCTVKPEESYSYTKGGNTPLTPQMIMCDGCIVTFDGEMSVDHRNTDIAHNLCNDNSYTVKISGRHDTKSEYTYTFTDEDYNRAAAANKESGE